MFTRYFLMKLDYLDQDHSHKMSSETLSVDHVLSQNPAADSSWRKDSDDGFREEWADRLRNLVLISAKKNFLPKGEQITQRRKPVILARASRRARIHYGFCRTPSGRRRS
ncbi:GmrSD restriction endonuclease domain-containing protein [Limnoglobus roseus]|uniref:GmrSD restriction endonuclease domain-containing protein n=1 Tax=Limnoglobus roseus TaxID=2598579 RepID=UPI0011EA8EF3